MESKQTITVSSKDGYYYNCKSPTGESLRLKKGIKIKDFPLSIGAEYLVSLNGEYINSAELVREGVSEESSTKDISPWEDKQNKIIAQSTLKEAVNIAAIKFANGVIDGAIEDEVIRLHKVLFKHVKGGNYEL